MKSSVLLKIISPLFLMALLSSCGGGSSASQSSISSPKEESTSAKESSSESVSSKEEISSSEEKESTSEGSSFSVEETTSEEESSSVEEESTSEEGSSEEESSSIESSEESIDYEIDEDTWKSIVEDGLMTSTSANFSCKWTTTIDGVPNPNYGFFYVDKGDLQRSVPASYNPNLILSEYFKLITWGNPESLYRHYTLRETWESEEIRSKFLHFYRDDLGIIIDLVFSELTYDETSHCYTCSKKVSYPYDSPSMNAKYEDIEVHFQNGKLHKIKYDNQGRVSVYDYYDYGTTVVALPSI